MPVPYREPTDHQGHRLYGNFVHQDLYRFRWLPQLLAVTLLCWIDFLPGLVKISAIQTFAGELLHTLIILIPRDTVPHHLGKKQKYLDACPSSSGSRAPRSTALGLDAPLFGPPEAQAPPSLRFACLVPDG